MIDDDVKGGRINNNGKTENIDLKSALATLEEFHILYGKGTVSGTEFNNLAFAHATKIVKQNPFYQVFHQPNSLYNTIQLHYRKNL